MVSNCTKQPPLVLVCGVMSYGGDPSDTSEDEFQEMVSNWQGYEAAAIEFLFVDYMIGRKKV